MIENTHIHHLTSHLLQGASIEIDGTKYPIDQLQGLAASLQPGATMKVFNSEKIADMSISALLLVKRGQVTLA